MSYIKTSSNLKSLIVMLEELAEKTEEEWRTSLCPRKIAELEFHDHLRDPKGIVNGLSADQRRENKKYYSTARKSKEYVDAWLDRHAKGRVFLDYACGDGFHTIRAAQAGASLAIGIDLSSVAVENSKRKASEAGVASNTQFVQADCENTGLPDNSIDVGLCCGMLHHLDLSFAFPELRRILKPGGVYLAVEALGYNPLIMLYRFLTPGLRTEWEKHHILSRKDLRFASRFFDVKNEKYWHLLSILTTPLRKTSIFEPALLVANALDSVLLKVYPLSLMAWQFSFELRKRREG